MRKHYIALALACALITPAAAQAHAHAHGARLTFAHPRHHLTTAVTSIQQGMGDVYSFGCQSLPLASASVVRVVVGSYDAPERWLTCSQRAQAAGYRVLLTVQYDGGWSIGQDTARLRTVLSVYGPTWAVAIGNEEELSTTGTAQTGAQYAATWRALEPIARQMVPHAVMVAGEISPWGLAFARDAIAAGLPGAGALSAHVYPDSGHGLDAAAFAALAHKAGMRAWATEGMCGPGAWMQYGCQSAAWLRHSGVSLGLVWYINAAVQSSGPVPVVADPATWSTL